MALVRKKLKSRRAQQERIDKTFACVAYVLLVISAVYLVCIWASERPSFFIDSVVVEGTHATSADSIKAAAIAKLVDKTLFHIKRNNRLLYPVAEMESDVYSLSPRIANVKTVFDTRTHVRIIITEYTPNFLYCMYSDSTTLETSTPPSDHQPKDCYFADEKGYVYAEAPEYIGYPFVAIVASSSEEAVTHASPVGMSVLSPEDYARIRLYIDDLSRVGLTTHSVTLLGGGDIRAEVGMPWVILLATDKDPDRAIANLGVVLANLEKSADKGRGVREIDLRFGNKIFYK